MSQKKVVIRRIAIDILIMSLTAMFFSLGLNVNPVGFILAGTILVLLTDFDHLVQIMKAEKK